LTRFDRKKYFYPDLPKAYQISQLHQPIGRNGYLEIETPEGLKKIGIHEIHMEEDAGKLIHDPWEDCTLVDYNRCGVPLLEIGSEPDLRSAEEALAYIAKLRSILQFLGVSDCRMEQGSLRADVNVSVRPAGSPTFGTLTELKNMNSFKAIGRAITAEARRQTELLEEGKTVRQETRRWD
jgi:aspartyl-tRNA(Asn)/glutamyl-tRNA(Gln) amidotransferase subunit B